MMELLNENINIPDKDKPFLNNWGYPNNSCPVTYAPLKEWGDLNTYYWDEMTAMFNIELLDQLYKKTSTWEERHLLYEVIRSDAKATWRSSLKDEDVYMWLCKIKIALMKAPSDAIELKRESVEQDVLFLKRGTDSLDTNYIKSCLKEMIRHGSAILEKGPGYVWYAVWLFFKKSRLLKNDSQRAFHRLMDCWFPNCGYGDDDKMRIYNSPYLEKYRWQIWKYDEFQRTAKAKATKRGFEAIRDLFEDLERSIDIELVWENEL